MKVEVPAKNENFNCTTNTIKPEMKCTTRQTPVGALAGTPFPPPWLARFSQIIPIQIQNLLSRTCKRIHQHLRLNAAWIERCRALPEWESELSEYERETWVPFEESFWYQWWCDRIPRSIPVTPTQGGLDWENAQPGALCSKHGNYEDPKIPILVIISKIRLPTEKRNGGFTYAQSLDPLSEIRRTNVVRFKMLSKYNNVIRPNGDTSICMGLIP
jgi:hypothetical protein